MIFRTRCHGIVIPRASIRLPNPIDKDSRMVSLKDELDELEDTHDF